MHAYVHVGSARLGHGRARQLRQEEAHHGQADDDGGISITLSLSLYIYIYREREGDM